MNSDELNSKGVELGKVGKNHQALVYFEKAVLKDPANTTAINNLALAYKNTEDYVRAIKYYEHALTVDPQRAKTYSDLGSVYYCLKDFKKARWSYRKAIKIDDSDAEFHCNLGTTLADLGLHKRAIKSLKKAIVLNPTLAEAYYNLGYIFQQNGNYKEAIYFFGQTLKYDPNMVYPHLYFMLRHICDWALLPAFETKLNKLTNDALNKGKTPDETPFINFVRKEDVKKNYELARVWANKIKNETLQTSQVVKVSFRKSRKIRLGYVSDAFYDFPTAHNITDVLKHHTRQLFEVYIYSHGPDDNSFWRKEIKKTASKFLDIKKLTDFKVAKLIATDKIDVLIDLKGHMRGNRLGIFAYRPAKVSASWIGFPCTTGASFIDYIIADKTVIPHTHKKYYSEKVVYLPNCYRTPDTSTPLKISKFQITKSKYGLPGNKVIFSSFNTPYKITSEMFDVWMRILKRVPDSVLWILSRHENVKKNLLKEMQSSEVLKDRIIFAERLGKREHLQRMALADLALDTHPVNGHTTTTDCLRVDVPVVTMLGKHFASRVSASCLKAIGLTNLVTKNLKEYENLAVTLGNNPKLIKKLKREIKKNKKNYPLFNIKAFTSDLEKIYLTMYKKSL